MAKLNLYKNGRDIELLNSKQRVFVAEYQKDFDAIRAYRAAFGMKSKNPSVQACKLLKHPVIRRILGKSQREVLERYQATRDEIIEQLGYMSTRDGADFVDAKGKLIQNINDLPPRARAAIDGIEQKVKTYRDESGEEVEVVETKLRLVSKASAVDMMMKHFGAYAAEKHDVTVQAVDWNQLYLDSRDRVNEIEARVLEPLQRIEGPKE